MSWLSSLFSKDKPLNEGINSAELVDILKYDFHNHILPGIDDGAKDDSESLILLEGMIAMGFKGFIMTPHVMNEFYRNSPEKIHSAFKRVEKLNQENNWNLNLHFAAEYFFDEYFMQLAKDNQLLTLPDGKSFLFELSYMHPPLGLNSVLFDLASKGYKPILAHPERYPYWGIDDDIWKTLEDLNVTLQLNMMSFAGYYGKTAQLKAEQFTKFNNTTLIGSDLHQEKQLPVIERAFFNPILINWVTSGKINNLELFN